LLDHAKDLRVRITSVSGDRLRTPSQEFADVIELWAHEVTLVNVASRHDNVDDDSGKIVDRCMLLIAWLSADTPSRCRESGIRIGDTKPLVGGSGFGGRIRGVDLDNGGGVSLGNRVPAHVGANERGVNVYCLTWGNPSVHTSLDAPLENPPESLLTPTLAYPRKAAVVRQCIMKPISREPPDRQVDLRVTHELAVVNDPSEEAG
jgi:hypothetical protein